MNSPTVAIYLRLSKEDSSKEESESIQNQRRMLLEKVRKENWLLFDIYTDEDYSGIDLNRPEFNRLLKDCEEGKIDIVLCKNQSRFSRDAQVIEKYIHRQFVNWHIRFIGLVDNVDTEILENKKSRQINALVNEWYLEDMSLNIRKTLRSKKENGLYTGPFAPYGYQKDPQNKNHLLIDDVVAPIIQKIFMLYQKGYSYRKIKEYLDSKKILSPYQYKKECGSSFFLPKASSSWSEKTIADILSNPTYLGHLVQGKYQKLSYRDKKVFQKKKEDWIITYHTQEAIIDEKTWECVQQRRKEKSRVERKSQEVSPFHRKVYCHICGSSFEKNQEYFICRDRRNHWQNCSNRKSISRKELEKRVWEDLFTHFSKEQVLEKISFPKTSYQRDTSLLEKELEKKKRALKRWYEEGTIIEVKEELEKEIAFLEGQYQEKEELVPKEITLSYDFIHQWVKRIEIGKQVSQEREIFISWNF